MKRLILVVCGIAIVAGLIGHLNRGTAPLPSEAQATAQAASAQPAAETQEIEKITAPRASAEPRADSAPIKIRTVLVAPSPPSAGLDPALVSEAVEALLSPQTTYARKQGVWRQLIEAGKLDEAIAELERKMASDPQVAEYAAVLGHAYIKKCGAIHDMREQAVLAMQADKLFDNALALDSSNWEARFTKAVAMSYWPANLNKGEEVIQHFETLVQQQELKPSQPEFAETYLWLGDQYEKAGRSDEALAIWERGSSLFPGHQQLQNRLAPTAR